MVPAELIGENIAMVVSTVAAAVAAICNARIAWKQRRQEMVPILCLCGAKAMPKERNLDFCYYPAILFFKNLGNGPASLMEVKLNDGVELNDSIECHIGTPISVPSGAVGEIKVWLPEKDKFYGIEVNLYYWDAENKAYRTTSKIRVRHQRTEEPSAGEIGASPDWQMNSETFGPTKRKKPQKVTHWQKRDQA